jgi:aminomethyltransferase
MNTCLLNEDIILSRTGYTGELGFEILGKHHSIIKIWNYLLNNNVTPAGLAVRDILRLEMKYCLYGNDIDESRNPLEAGLSWILDFDKNDFLGKDKLLEIKSKKLTKKLCGFVMSKQAIPRKGYNIYSNNKHIGLVTSGNYSPILSKGIGLGYINIGYHKIGNNISIDIRGKHVEAKIVQTPFINKTSLLD